MRDDKRQFIFQLAGTYSSRVSWLKQEVSLIHFCSLWAWQLPQSFMWASSLSLAALWHFHLSHGSKTVGWCVSVSWSVSWHENELYLKSGEGVQSGTGTKVEKLVLMRMRGLKKVLISKNISQEYLGRSEKVWRELNMTKQTQDGQ